MLLVSITSLSSVALETNSHDSRRLSANSYSYCLTKFASNLLIEAIVNIGGGFVAVLEGKLLSSVRLDVAGCTSSELWGKVRDDSIACDDSDQGGKLKSP
jgi:adenine deaminase